MEPGVARMDFELDAISVEFGREVEERLNAELAKGYPTEVLYLPRAAALTDPDLIRTKVNLIPEWVEEIRVVDIVGLDRQADGGTHVRSTLEVGPIRVKDRVEGQGQQTHADRTGGVTPLCARKDGKRPGRCVRERTESARACTQTHRRPGSPWHDVGRIEGPRCSGFRRGAWY
jgi:hypothetical protein